MSDMPESIKDIFNELKNEVIWLQTKWVNYRQLFGGSDTRLKLLTKCAHAFFLITHNALVVDVLMTLGKLIDPAGRGKRKNLSFEQLQKQVEKNGDRELGSKLGEILGALKEKSRRFEAVRNKRLAHLDLKSR